MTAVLWDVRFVSIGIDPGSPDHGTLGLAALDGPERVRVVWGSTGPDGLLPPITFHRPLTSPPFAAGLFAMPGLFDDRPYADGSYTLRVTGFFDGDLKMTEILKVFMMLSDTVGVDQVGTGRDDLFHGGEGGDTLRGGRGDDLMQGNAGADLLLGGDGDDHLVGDPDGAGADTLLGGRNSDLLEGGAGNDLLRGGEGDDLVYGDEGDDTLLGEDGDDFAEGIDGDDLLVGGAGHDTLAGDYIDYLPGDPAGADTLHGGDGDDFLVGGDGDDLLRGDADHDTLLGELGADTMIGGTGDDVLVGEEGADRLVGGAGLDIFLGGAGNDTLISEADGVEDIFVYETLVPGAIDRMFGFEAGLDTIEIYGVDAAEVGAGRFVSSLGAMTDTNPHLIYEASGLLRVDLNGTDPGQLYRIAVLVGAPALAYDDLVLIA